MSQVVVLIICIEYKINKIPSRQREVRRVMIVITGDRRLWKIYGTFYLEG